MCIDEHKEVCKKDDSSACGGVPKPDKDTHKMTFANAVFMIKTPVHQRVVVIE